jgi:hypothetical protein
VPSSESTTLICAVSASERGPLISDLSRYDTSIEDRKNLHELTNLFIQFVPYFYSTTKRYAEIYRSPFVYCRPMSNAAIN